MFLKALPWTNKDKTKTKVKMNAAPFARQFSSKLSFLMDRRAPSPSGGHAFLKDDVGEVSEDISAACIADLCMPQLPIDGATTSGDAAVQDSSVGYHSGEIFQAKISSEVPPPPPASAPEASEPTTSPAPAELPVDQLTNEPADDETPAQLTFAFADSFSDTDSDIDDVPLGDPTADDYIFQCVLGDGSEGIVFLAIGRRDRKPYAVKVVPKEVLPEGQYGNLFTSQYAMKAMKGSPFIIDLQAAFETTENFIFVFPFYANGDLKEEMHDLGRYSEADTRTRIAQLVIALQELHNNRIMHRDLKPENILLNSVGNFVLTDFGLCHTFGRPVEEQPWRVAGIPDWELAEDYDPEGHQDAGGGDKTRLFCGTPNYIAPEVYGKGSDGWYSYPADVWSFGIILYEMLHGKLPFGLSHEQADEFDPMTCILYADLIVDSSLSDDANDLLCKLLEKNPNDRPRWDAIKSHPWFNGIEWDTVAPREPPPAQLMITLESLPPIADDIRNIQFGEPYAPESAPYPYFKYTSPDHLQHSGSTTPLYTGSPDWVPTPSVLEGFGWPVASPGNAFVMCPRLSSAPNLQKTREVPSFRVLHRPVYGSIGWDDDDRDGDNDNDNLSMCSVLAQNMRAGRVPGLQLDVKLPSAPGSASNAFSQPSSSHTLPAADRSGSPASVHNSPVSTAYSTTSPRRRPKGFRGDTPQEGPPFRKSSSTPLALFPTSMSPTSMSSAASPTRTPISLKRAFVPITSTPLRGTRKVSSQYPSASLSTPHKRSASLTLSDIIQFSDIPSFCLSTPESLCQSSAPSSSPAAVDASSLSRTMVASTLSGEGLLKLVGLKAASADNTSDDCQPFVADTSMSSSGTLALSPSKPWAKKVVGMVKGWLKPSHRRERRRGFDVL